MNNCGNDLFSLVDNRQRFILVTLFQSTQVYVFKGKVFHLCVAREYFSLKVFFFFIMGTNYDC